ncbi:hypothetical protein LJR290_007092 [Variovorax sp. LjRoot290]|uniref:hypothetical protein n=1 Tax=Variovorax sp. LjRoot290 TaxID=3342316 RepID=UPI003ED041FC
MRSIWRSGEQRRHLCPSAHNSTWLARRRAGALYFRRYAAFDSSPPAIMVVVRPDKMSVAPHGIEWESCGNLGAGDPWR